MLLALREHKFSSRLIQVISSITPKHSKNEFTRSAIRYTDSACRHCSNYILDWTPRLQWIGQKQLQDETRNIYVLGFGAAYIRGLTVFTITIATKHALALFQSTHPPPPHPPPPPTSSTLCTPPPPPPCKVCSIHNNNSCMISRVWLKQWKMDIARHFIICAMHELGIILH